MAAYQGGASARSISAMPVLIAFEATWGEYKLSRRGDEYVFQFTIAPEIVREEGSYEPRWRYSYLNADAILDKFQTAKTPTEALDFLNQTGRFSLLGEEFSWSYFKRWQRFAYLVQEHDMLASSMLSGNHDGETGEALKALAGNRGSAFFDGTELKPVGTPAQLEERALWLLDSENSETISKQSTRMAAALFNTCRWFRQPPDGACSIEWVPKNDPDAHTISPLVDQGAMAEFLLPQQAMRPILFIQPSNTLQAIAAVIYADRISGVEYRACEVCSNLFEVGTRGEKKYCSRERCKNTAHQRRMRANRAKAQKKIANQTKGRRSNGSV
jgi:hypothetical protein